EDGIRDDLVTGVQTCALPISPRSGTRGHGDRIAAEAAIVTQFEVVRDPLWDNIRLDPEALAVVDTPAVQRLRYVRQLGHAFLVRSEERRVGEGGGTEGWRPVE